MHQTTPGDSPPDVGVVVAAAGRGERAGRGELKQFRLIGGVPMLLRAIRPFAQHPQVSEIVVALPPPFHTEPPSWLAPVAGERLRLVEGGETRTASVRAALEALSPHSRIVLVHDAARPFVVSGIIDGVIATAGRGTGAVPAVPLLDTLKRTDSEDGCIQETVDRAGLWRAQTPQGFPRDMLEAAYRMTTEDGGQPAFTDEAALVEAAGYRVRIVPGDASNIKVTTPDDFSLAEALARQ